MQNNYREMTLAEKRKFWEEQIRFWQESGLSQSEYCKRHGIRSSQWFYWKRRCRKTEKSVTLVPLRIPGMLGGERKAPTVRLTTPNGFTIELNQEASRLSLQQLIREVAAI